MAIPENYQRTIDAICNNLTSLLSENLYSCVLYGSTVRGNVVAGVSDINLLLVLNESTPSAHAAIADCIQTDIPVDPFIISRHGMERSFQVFALKFRSIKRHYKVLAGVDPVRGFSVSNERIRFLCEQNLRNLRLRSVHNFINLRKDPKRYFFYIRNLHTVIFTYVSEILRVEGQDVPEQFMQRIAQIEKSLNIDAGILARMDSIRSDNPELSEADVADIHNALFGFLNRILQWIEKSWPTLN